MRTLRGELDAARHEGPDVLAQDVDERAIRTTRENALRAKVKLRTVRALVESLPPVLDGRTVVVNPPYGERLAMEIDTFRPVGRALAGLSGGTVGILLGTPEMLGALGRKPSRLHDVWNGDIECRFAVFDVRSSSGRATGRR